MRRKVLISSGGVGEKARILFSAFLLYNVE
jgi:hypothetical protein